jgi:hypothetical protein
MRTSRHNAPAPSTSSAPRSTSWIPSSSTSRVGIDPACWSTRVRQVALWRAMDGWYQRRTH